VRSTNLVEVDARPLGFGLARKIEQVLDDAAGAFGFLIDLVRLGELRGRQAVAEQKLRVSHDGGERIIELVRDAGNEVPERGHLFGLQELRFESQPFALDRGIGAIRLQAEQQVA